MEKYALLKVQWVDAHNVAGGWHDSDELSDFAKNEAYRVISVGYCVKEDDKMLVLCSRYSPGTDEYGEHFGMIERLPKKMIDKIQAVHPPSLRKKAE